MREDVMLTIGKGTGHGHAERRRRRKEAGLCARCGKAPPAQGKTACEACGGKLRDYDARSRKKPENVLRKSEVTADEDDGRFDGVIAGTVWNVRCGASLANRRREIGKYL